MSKELDKLLDIGIQKIYKDTHIAKHNVQAVLNANFEALAKIPFFGFVSILEREYKVDLSELKDRGTAFFDNDTSDEIIKENFFIDEDNQVKYKFLYAVIFISLFGFLLYYTVFFMDDKGAIIDDSIIDNAKSKLINAVENKKDIAVSDVSDNLVQQTEDDQNVSKVDIVEPTTEDSEQELTTEVSTQEPATEVLVQESNIEIKNLTENGTVIPDKKLFIVAKKVWLGLYNLTTKKSYQKTIFGKYELNEDSHYLLHFGNDRVELYVKGKKKTFQTKYSLRLKYVNGILTRISKREYEELQRGLI